jgi:hypothetical protein
MAAMGPGSAGFLRLQARQCASMIECETLLMAGTPRQLRQREVMTYLLEACLLADHISEALASLMLGCRWRGPGSLSANVQHCRELLQEGNFAATEAFVGRPLHATLPHLAPAVEKRFHVGVQRLLGDTPLNHPNLGALVGLVTVALAVLQPPLIIPQLRVVEGRAYLRQTRVSSGQSRERRVVVCGVSLRCFLVSVNGRPGSVNPCWTSSRTKVRRRRPPRCKSFKVPM